MSLHDLIKVFQEAAKTRGQMLAISRIAEKIPDVAAAVMEDATPGVKTCGLCLGATRLPKPTADDPQATAECHECRGTGLVHHHPEHDVQKTALKIAGLLDSHKGMNLNILQQQLNAPRTDTLGFDQLMEGLDTVLYGKGRDRLVATESPDDTRDALSDPQIIDGDLAP